MSGWKENVGTWGIVDSWRSRRWLRPWCALFGHREWGHYDNRLNGAPMMRVFTCSCGHRRWWRAFGIDGRLLP